MSRNPYIQPEPFNHLPAIHKAINFYQTKLTEKFPFAVLTPALLYQLNDTLRAIQLFQQKTETHYVWNIPVKVIRNPKKPLQFMVVVEDENGTESS